MNFKQLAFNTPIWRNAVSRRQFLGSAAGAAGLVLGWRAGLARAAGSKQPVPIPGCLNLGGEHFHVCGPRPGPTANQDPATITDFDGFVGLAFINGMVTETNVKTGASRRLPFLSSDMRFTQGFYRDVKGKVRSGTFALV